MSAREMTDDKRLLEFAGVEFGGSRVYRCCGFADRHWSYNCGNRIPHEPHDVGVDIGLPPLTGDFADAVEAKIRRRLNEEGWSVSYWSDGSVHIFQEYSSRAEPFWQGDNLNAATLAYLRAKEKGE